MNVGKAIYYLLANNANVSAITTRIYPEIAPQDAAAPYIVYTISNVSPDDTHDGPATIDEVRMEITCVADTYDVAGDLAAKARVALDRVYGTYNTVNVESIQFQDVQIQVRDTPRQYGQELTFIVRVKRDDVQIATGSPIEDITLGRLADVNTDGAADDQVLTYDAASGAWSPEDASTVAALNDLTDVNIDDPIDRQALVYDEASGDWINTGSASISIPVFNNSQEEIVPGRPLSAVGAQGDRISVEPYQTSYGPLRFVGIAGETIPGRSNGHATVYGEIRKLDTSNFEVGDFLYPVTGTNPTFYPYGLFKWTDANDSPLVCAIVTRKQQNTGRIFIRMWSPGYRNELRRMNDVQISTEFEGALLKYDSSIQKWAVPPQTSKLILEGATETVEIYYYSITTDTQQYRDAQSDTPSAGNVIRRKIWYSTTAQADIDSGSWTLLETLADDATYAQLVTAFENQLKTSPGGDTPVSIKTTWEDVPAFSGLLDDYPGAAAAYSLRLLDADYAGSAIRVRRASDNAEQDIGFDSNGDLDTTALATFCSGTDGFVKVWYDQAGANDATQTTTGSQPKIYDAVAGLVQNNGKPSIEFAAGDFMSNTTWDGAATTYIFNVLQSNGLETTPRIAVDIGSFVEYYGLGVDGNTGASSAGIGSVSHYSNGVAIGTTRDNMWDAMQVQNVLTVTGDFSSWTGGFGLSRSGQQMYTYAQEFVIYNSDQSSNRTGIESNINDNYLIHSQSPTGLLADYPGAAAAYSLRQLISTAQLAIAVRRDSDDAVLGIGFVNGELDTTTLASFCAGTDGFVSVWFDQSGAGNHATQTTTSAQPKIYDSATGVVLNSDSKPACDFNVAAASLGVSNTFFINQDVIDMFVVVETNDTSGIMFGCAGSEYIGYLGTSTNRPDSEFGTPTYYVDGVDNSITTRAEFTTYVKTGVPVLLSIQNGDTQLWGDFQSTLAIGSYALNNGLSANGKYSEVVIYASDQSTNRTGIESNINTYYSIYP